MSTNEGIKVMSLQEVFDTVTAHLLKQRKQSLFRVDGVGVVCAYRGDNDCMCAVGPLIKQEFYKRKLEARGITHYSVQAALVRSGALPFDCDKRPPYNNLLFSLQSIHDAHPVCDWAHDLKTLAAKLDLEYKGTLT